MILTIVFQFTKLQINLPLITCHVMFLNAKNFNSLIIILLLFSSENIRNISFLDAKFDKIQKLFHLFS